MKNVRHSTNVRSSGCLATRVLLDICVSIAFLNFVMFNSMDFLQFEQYLSVTVTYVRCFSGSSYFRYLLDVQQKCLFVGAYHTRSRVRYVHDISHDPPLTKSIS